MSKPEVCFTMSKFAYFAYFLVVIICTGCGGSGGGGSNDENDDLSPVNSPPISEIISPENNTTFSVGDEISFAGTGTDSDGSIASYEWDFGDGQTSTEQNPVHNYSSEGSFTVVLKTVDNLGAHGSTSIILIIQASAGIDKLLITTTKVESVNVQIPENRENITLNSLKIRSFIDSEDAVDNKPLITNIGGPSVVMAQDEQDRVLLLGYAIPQTAQTNVLNKIGFAKAAIAAKLTDTTILEVSHKSTALTLVMLNGIFMGSTGEERSVIASDIISSHEFELLSAEVFDTFSADPFFLSHLDLYPHIVTRAAEIANKGVDEFLEKNNLEAGSQVAKQKAVVPGTNYDDFYWGSPWNEEEPWVWYEDDDSFWKAPFLASSSQSNAIGNPALVAYAAEYYDSYGNLLPDWQYVQRPSSLLQKGLYSGASKTVLNIPDNADYV